MTTTPCGIIDFHTHAFPDALAWRAIKTLGLLRALELPAEIERRILCDNARELLGI